MTRAPITYLVNCPLGMLAFGRTAKTFTSPHAFDGYVCALRALGMVVTFSTPQQAICSRGAA